MKTKINVFLSFGSQSDRNYCIWSFHRRISKLSNQWQWE